MYYGWDQGVLSITNHINLPVSLQLSLALTADKQGKSKEKKYFNIFGHNGHVRCWPLFPCMHSSRRP